MAVSGLDRQRAYRERHPDRVRESRRSYRERHADAVKIDLRIRSRDRRETWRRRALAALGDRCTTCGLDDIRALEIDHVADDGKNELRRVFSYDLVAYYKHVVAEASSGRYQVLCANHNRIKEWERRRAARFPGERGDGSRGPGRARLTAADVAEVRRLYAEGGITQAGLGERFGVARSTVSHVVRGETWQEAGL